MKFKIAQIFYKTYQNIKLPVQKIKKNFDNYSMKFSEKFI